jgi:hypothetical protein
VTTALFSIAGAVALLAAVVVVTSRRIVHAALWLVVALGAVAGCFGAGIVTGCGGITSTARLTVRCAPRSSAPA